MNAAPRFIAAAAFTAIAVFLVVYTWLPDEGALQRSDGVVTAIRSLPNTWYEVRITTANGGEVACRTRRNWPLLGPSRCPLEKFERLMGRTVTVLHDGNRPYEVKAGAEPVIDFGAHRRAQIVGIVLAAALMAGAAWVVRKR